MNGHGHGLHLVTDRELTRGRTLTEIVAQAAAGGVTAVQLREKTCSTREFIELGRALSPLLQRARIPLIINDRVDVALALQADGVHLGQSDMPYPEARRLLGARAIIGLSVESLADAAAAESYDVDYLGISPIFATPTKAELINPLGLIGIRHIRAVSRHALVAIGGINATNAAAVMAAGADGIAVVSAICGAPDPFQATVLLCSRIRRKDPATPQETL